MTVMRIAGLIVNVLALGFLVGCVRNDSEVITNHDDVVGSRRAAGEHNANVSEGPAPASRNVTEFFTRFDSALESKRFEDALDFLRAAMVVAPGDERTLQAAERFVAAATAEAEKQDQGAEVFVDVGIDQLEGLIPFQQPDRIPHVRARVRELRAARTVEYPVVDPVKALHGELKLVAASKARVEVKLRSLHAIRAELESLEALALREGRELSSTIDVEIDRVEFEVLAEAYQPLRERRKAWVNDQVIPTINRINEQPSAPQRMQLETDCLKLLNDGRRFLPELAPFAEADVPDAKRHLDDTYDRLERLTKAREMNYNLWALARIREAESSEGNKFGTCRLLVREIDEQRLSPWVLERFTQIYKKLFEELSDSDKVLITRARILGRLAD